MPTTAMRGSRSHNFIQVAHGLAGGQNGAGYSGPGFIDAIELTVAEVALHITFGRHRKMNAPKQVS